MFKKGVERLLLLVVPEVAYDSEWVSPSSAQHKPKSNRVRLLSDVRNWNKELKWKLYPMPNINDMLLKWEGFNYATPLDFYMGYYHIRLSKNAGNFCTIILPWVKYSYKCLPMGVANSLDIFQHKMNNLFHGFEFICAHIDELLILTKVDWKDNVHKIELIFNKLKVKGLKYKIKNEFFGKTEINI